MLGNPKYTSNILAWCNCITHYLGKRIDFSISLSMSHTVWLIHYGSYIVGSFWEIKKALICVFPLSLSIFLLVPLLSGPLVVHKTRISLVSTLLQRPIELATISFSGAALHYLLPILNPIVNVNVDQQPLTVRDSQCYFWWYNYSSFIWHFLDYFLVCFSTSIWSAMRIAA